MYEATAQVLITLPNPNGQQSGTSIDQATELLLMESPAVRGAVTKQLGHVPDVSVEPVGSTNVIAITAQSTSARGAARDANVYARVYVDLHRQQTTAAVQDLQTKIQELDTRSAELDAAVAATAAADRSAVIAQQADERSRIATDRTRYSNQLDGLLPTTTAQAVSLVARATVPTSPVKPKTVLNVLLALVIGLALGVAAAFVREHFDDTVHGKSDVERIPGGVAVVGMIPSVKGWKRKRAPELVVSKSPNSRAAEAYRTLRTSLQFLSVSRPIRVLQVTSPSAAAGKTTAVANLAVAAAHAGNRRRRDVLRPAPPAGARDLRPHQRRRPHLGAPRRGDACGGPPERARVSPDWSWSPRVRHLPTRPRWWRCRKTAEILRTLRESCDLLIVDSTPVLPVTDALIVSRLVDATLIVATTGSTTKRELQRTVELLRSVDAPLVGAVLNYPESRSGDGYGSGYEYGYGPQAERQQRIPRAQTKARRECRTLTVACRTPNSRNRTAPSTRDGPFEHQSLTETTRMLRDVLDHGTRVHAVASIVLALVVALVEAVGFGLMYPLLQAVSAGKPPTHGCLVERCTSSSVRPDTTSTCSFSRSR